MNYDLESILIMMFYYLESNEAQKYAELRTQAIQLIRQKNVVKEQENKYLH